MFPQKNSQARGKSRELKERGPGGEKRKRPAYPGLLRGQFSLFVQDSSRVGKKKRNNEERKRCALILLARRGQRKKKVIVLERRASYFLATEEKKKFTRKGKRVRGHSRYGFGGRARKE